MYRVEKQYEGCYEVHDDEGRIARVARFMPGHMVSVDGQHIHSPAAARAVARAMLALADEIEPDHLADR